MRFTRLDEPGVQIGEETLLGSDKFTSDKIRVGDSYSVLLTLNSVATEDSGEYSLHIRTTGSHHLNHTRLYTKSVNLWVLGEYSR